MMCLAIPAKLVVCTEGEAVADLHGNRVSVSTVLVPEVQVGDWVLIHAGFAIQRMDEQTAKETWELLEEVAAEGRHEGTEARRHEGNPKSEIRNPKSQ